MNKRNEDTIEAHIRGNALLRLLAYMKPYRLSVAVCLAFVLALTAFDLYRPKLIGDAIDAFQENADFLILKEVAIRYGIVLILSFAMNSSQAWLLQKTGQRIILTIRLELYRHLQSLSSRF